jgi:hypothetical protein
MGVFIFGTNYVAASAFALESATNYYLTIAEYGATSHWKKFLVG